MKTLKLLLVVTVLIAVYCSMLLDIGDIENMIIENSVNAEIEKTYPDGIVYADSTKGICITMVFFTSNLLV